MNFFDMGIGEILLIIVVALIIWGPEKIPHVARTMGKTLAMLKKTSQDLTSQITKELDIEESDKKVPPYRRPEHTIRPADAQETENSHMPPVTGESVVKEPAKEEPAEEDTEKKAEQAVEGLAGLFG